MNDNDIMELLISGLLSILIIVGGIIAIIFFIKNHRKNQRIKTGIPSEKDIYSNFVRAWNNKVYSAANSKFLYIDRNERHLYRHCSGDYFWVWIPLYEEWGYQIDTKDRAKKYIISNICSENLEYSTELLKTEFNEILQDNHIVNILRAKKINKLKRKLK